MDRDQLLWRCTLPMKRGILDNDYLFYKSGKIIHEFDKTQDKINLSEEVTSDEISDLEKSKIMDCCPEQIKNVICNIIYPN